MAVTAEKVVVELEAEYQKFVQDTANAAKRFEDSLAGMVKSGRATEAQIKEAFGGIGNAAEKAANDNAQGAERAGATFGSKFGTGFVRNALASILGGGLLAAIVADARAMGDLEDAARRANIPLAEMQETIGVLRREGLSESGAVRDIQNLTKLIADAADNPRNGLRRLFEVNGIKIDGKDANAVILDLARLMQNAPEGMKTKIAEISGLSEKWIAVLEKGPEAFLKAREEAAAAGDVLDELAFKKAAEFRKAWDDAVTQWGSTMRREITDILPLLQTVITKAIEFAGIIARTVGIIATELGNIGSLGGLDIYSDEQLKMLRDFQSNPLTGNKDRLREIERALTARSLANEAGPASEPLRLTVRQGGTRLPGPYRAQSDKDPAEDALRKRIAALKAEAETIGDTYFQRDALKAQTELLTAAYNAGLKPSAELTEHTRKLGEEYARAAEKVRLAKDQWEAANAIAREFGNSAIDGIQGLISGTKNLNQVLADTLRTLSNMALKAALLGEGPLASFFGTKSSSPGGVGGLLGPVASGLFGLFGGARAEGGPVSPGRVYKVGERGEEYFTPSVAGYITPNGGTKNASGGLTMFNDFRDSSSSAIAAIMVKLGQLERSIGPMAIAAVSGERRLSPAAFSGR